MNSEQLGTGIVYENMLSLQVDLLDSQPSEAQIRSVNDSNEEILRNIGVLDEKHSEISEDESAAVVHDLQRLEIKVDIIIVMLGTLINKHLDIPKRKLLCLGGDLIQWLDEDLPKEGALLKFSLYLSRHYPQPVVLYGQALALAAQPGEYNNSAKLLHLSQLAQEALDKFIFRQHRRSVAMARQS